ncbi:MAG: ATP-binding protein [Thalassobius sp.]|nr:ATP-binding protein [Thalassovita sp.]
MEELHKLETYSIETIQSFIDNEIEESIHIEFKSGEALSKNDSKKKEVSKDVSAFANSDGGIIVYGLKESNHKASELSFINGNEFSKEWLEQIISTTINRNIPSLKIHPIRVSNDILKSIYVVQIPSSIDAPHQCRDKRFYRRYNFESVPMEEYEIRQLYGRKVKSKLILSGFSISLVEISEDTSIFRCETSVYNEGETFEKDYKVNIYFDNYNKHISISWESQGVGRNYDYTKIDDSTIKISNSSLPIIYANETVNAIRFNFQIENKFLEEALKNLRIRFLLFYPNGIDEMDTDLVELSQEINKHIDKKERIEFNINDTH